MKTVCDLSKFDMQYIYCMVVKGSRNSNKMIKSSIIEMLEEIVLGLKKTIRVNEGREGGKKRKF